MRSLTQLISKILPGPVFVMPAIAPQLRPGNIIDKPFEGYPDILPILSVPKGQLGPGKPVQVELI